MRLLLPKMAPIQMEFEQETQVHVSIPLWPMTNTKRQKLSVSNKYLLKKTDFSRNFYVRLGFGIMKPKRPCLKSRFSNEILFSWGGLGFTSVFWLVKPKPTWKNDLLVLLFSLYKTGTDCFYSTIQSILRGVSSRIKQSLSYVNLDVKLEMKYFFLAFVALDAAFTWQVKDVTFLRFSIWTEQVRNNSW